MKIMVNEMPRIPRECLFCSKSEIKIVEDVKKDDKLTSKKTLWLCEFNRNNSQKECLLMYGKSCRYLKKIKREN